MIMRDANNLEVLDMGSPGHDIADAVSVAVELPKIKDWENHSIIEPGPDDVVKVWSINTHRDPSYTDCVIMGWQDMLEELKLIFEAKLESMDMEELQQGMRLEVKLVEMRYADYVDCEI